MIPEEVCHFTKAETAINKILLEKRFRIGQLKYTNDPRESKSEEPILFHRGDLRFNSDSRGLDLRSKLASEFIRVQLNEWKVSCFTLHKSIKKSIHRENDIYNSHIRFGYCNPALWAHYAENHRGVCLVFSGNQLNRNIQNELSSKCKILSGKVNYSINSNLTGNPALAVKSLDTNVQEVVRAHFLMYWKELFLHKHPNWIYENEYRWLLHSAEEENHFVSIQNTLKAVIVGIDFPKKMETKLKALCQELNIPAGKMDWFNGIAYPKLQSIYEP